MPRYRGHFYNWYDTRTLAPLAPAYISTVDSGNLAGYLLTLQARPRAAHRATPIIDARRRSQGIGDVAAPVRGRARRRRPSGAHAQPAAQGARRGLAAIARRAARRRSAAGGRCSHDSATGIESLGVTAARDRGIAAGATRRQDQRRARVLARARRSGDRAAAGDLERLAPAGRRRRRRAARRGLRRLVPSLAELVRWCDRGVERLDGRRAERRRARSNRARAANGRRADRSRRAAGGARRRLRRGNRVRLSLRSRSGSSSRSATASPTGGSTARTTTRWRRRRASPASSRSRTRQDPARTLVQARTLADAERARRARCSRGARRCSSTSCRCWSCAPIRARCSTRPTAPWSSGRCSTATQRGVPWGISESAYNAQDLDGNYQYRAFGVPGLGLKRGLADDLVVAPYATMLAAPLAPARSASAISSGCARKGLAGRYGYYEAIDYTPERLPEDADRRRAAADVHGAPPGHEPASRSTTLLNGSPMQDRFHADPRDPGGRAAAAGADPAARAAQEPADRDRGSRAVGTRGRCRRGPPLRDAAHAQPARASAVERLVRRDGHQRAAAATAGASSSR